MEEIREEMEEIRESYLRCTNVEALVRGHPSVLLDCFSCLDSQLVPVH